LKEYIKKSSIPRNPGANLSPGGSTTMSIKNIKNVMIQILKGLKYCHQSGLMHRNLKPHNILVQEDGTVKISDFTLSRIGTSPHCPYTPEDPKERDRSTREVKRLWYRAPEMIFRKEVYAFEVDLWSVG